MAWDEWEQLKAAAAERQTAHMQINQVEPSGASATSSVTGGLKSTKKAWVAAGEGVHSQREALDKALAQVSDGQKGLGGNTGCLTAAAQREVYGSWKRYAHSLGKKCDGLQQILEKTGHDLLITDASVKAELDKLSTEFKDTTAVGGRTGGR
ncbi:hypothetical protein GCM10023080_009220 [Streptomyces pseudoechinosporeus]